MVLSIKFSNLSYEKASGCWCAGGGGGWSGDDALGEGGEGGGGQ